MSRRRVGKPEATDPIEGRVRDVAHGGEAVVETERGVVLAPFAWIGERVRLRDVRRSGGVLRGRVERVVEPSPERVAPECPLAVRCGGCPLLHVGLGSQRAWKTERVRKALASVPQVPGLAPQPEDAGDAWGYRRRARLAWVRSSHGLRMGYYGRRSHDVVDVPRCPIMEPALDRGWEVMRRHLQPALQGEGRIQLVRGPTGRAVALLRSSSPQPPAVYTAAENLAEEPVLDGVSLQAGGASAAAEWGQPFEQVTGADGDPLVAGDPDSFSQAHEAVNRRLGAHVADLAAPHDARVLELYAGRGNLSVVLAPHARSLTVVERDPSAAAELEENLRGRGTSARVVQEDATRGASTPADVAVLDPPRAGAREAITVLAGNRHLRRIVYVSCDPATLGRDLTRLGEAGWQLDAVRVLDMFPQTAHVEVVARLQRRSCPHGRAALDERD